MEHYAKCPGRLPLAKAQSRRKLHFVKANLAVRRLTKAGSSLELEIFGPGKEKLGTLEVGSGAIYWWGKNRRSPKRLSWSKFAEYMDSLERS